MYRPPISSGWGVFGQAIAGGVMDGVDRYTGGRARRRAEDEERRRYGADAARQKRMDARADADYNRRISLENAELGVIGADEAYESVPMLTPRATEGPLSSIMARAGTPVAAGPVQTERPMGPLASALAQPGTREALASAQPATDRRLRDGVRRVGEMYIDPRRSLAQQRALAVAEREQEIEQQEREQRLAEVEAFTQGLPPEQRTRVIAQAVYGIGLPQDRDEELAELEGELELRDRFQAREDKRRFEQDRTLRSISAQNDNRPSPSEARAERNNTLSSVAAAAAWDAVEAGTPDVRRVAAQIQQGAAALNVTITPQEAQALAVQHMEQQTKRRATITGEETGSGASRATQARQESVRLRNDFARRGMTRGQAVSEMLDQGKSDAEIRRVLPEVTQRGLDLARQQRARGGQSGGQPQGRGATQTQPRQQDRRGQRGGQQPQNGDGAASGNPRPVDTVAAKSVDPAVVAEGARRLRAGANLDHLRAAGFTEEEIYAMQNELRR